MGIFDKFMEEEYERRFKLGIKKGMKIAQLFHTGRTVKEISLETGVSEELLKELLQTKVDQVEKRINQAGKRARMEAEFHGTYIVYLNEDGDMVKEYPDGEIRKIKERKDLE